MQSGPNNAVLKTSQVPKRIFALQGSNPFNKSNLEIKMNRHCTCQPFYKAKMSQ